jgi:glyoxylate reductase
VKVFVSYRFPEAALARIKEKFDVSVNEEQRLLSKEELSARVVDVDALVCLGNRVDRDVIDAGKKLKIVANYGVGYNNIDAEYAAKKQVMVTNTPGVLTETTADLTWAILMAIARRIVEADRFTKSGRFAGFDPYRLLGTERPWVSLGSAGSVRRWPRGLWASI